MVSLADFKYNLPENLIAKEPAEPRDSSRLLSYNRAANSLEHYHFFDLDTLLKPTDVLVLNQTKVFPARLFGHKSTGGHVEILLIRQLTPDTWLSICSPGLKKGKTLKFDYDLQGEVVESFPETGQIHLKFNFKTPDFFNILDKIGHTPIPPYISSSLSETDLRQKYQTVYASNLGSAAAPTAGLHFTPKLLKRLTDSGVSIEYVTLHVGLGTFKPIDETNIQTKSLHTEVYEIDQKTADNLNKYKKQGRRVIAVGTTSLRTLESNCLLNDSHELTAGSRTTNLFVFPPYQFNFVDGLITNFHLSESSLLMLVSAFCSFPNSNQHFTDFANSSLGLVYSTAIKHGYRFFSFGDATLIL